MANIGATNDKRNLNHFLEKRMSMFPLLVIIKFFSVVCGDEKVVLWTKEAVFFEICD